MSNFSPAMRLCAGFAIVVATAPLAGCATSGFSSVKMPLFSEVSRPTGTVSKVGGPSGYASERAYYEQYVKNGYTHRGLRPPAGRDPGAARHDVVPNEARQQAAFDPKKVGAEPKWHGGTQPVDEAPRTFRVQQGDSIDWIARVHNVSINDLMRVNRLRTAAVHPGQTLVIPTEVSVNPFEPKTAQPVSYQQQAAYAPDARNEPGLSANGKFYVVDMGDTFYSIARGNRVDPVKLAELNQIEDTSSIRPGQRLKLPPRW